MQLKTKDNITYISTILIPWLFAFVFFVLPVGYIIIESISQKEGFLDNYYLIIQNSIYVDVLFNTLLIAFVVTIITLLIGYPLAFLLTKLTGKSFYFVLIIVLIPFVMNQLSRNFTWILILDNKGIINSILISIGIISKPLELIYNRIGVSIVLVHGFIPIMVLNIYTSLTNINKDLVSASLNLGANKLQTFVNIILPLSFPGLISGSFFVFILTFGYYITPAMLGGNKGLMIAKIVDQLLNREGNQELATALSVLLIILCIPSLLFLHKAFNKYRFKTSL